MKQLTLGSLFDGSGGFPLGAIMCGIKPVWCSEIEPFPIRVTTKRLPEIKHYGDISSLSGANIEFVDIITFGSPCQDMSIAGKREGLSGSRSSLFYEAIRIVKEMRCASNGKYPRYAVWENVLGVFSSNKGDDFKVVLEEICKVKDADVFVPKPEKWQQSGEIVADDYSVAWRVFDAQFWGVPQRRKRVFLVADFTDRSAGKILFESESLHGYSAKSRKPWKRIAAYLEKSAGTTSVVCLNDQGGNRMDITENITSTLRAESHNPPCITVSAGFCTEHSSKAHGIGFKEETAPTLRAGTVPAAVYENHSQDTRYTEIKNISPTVSATYRTGGNNQPFVVEKSKCYDVRFTSEGTINSRQNCYETETTRTIDTGGNSPDSNQGGVAVVALQGSMIGRKEKNGPQGSGINENISFTLNAADKHAVAYGIDRAAFNQGQNAKYDISINKEVEPTITASGPGAVAQSVYSSSKASFFCNSEKELANTLVATDYKDPPLINEKYIVRRLTPTECARLQGFPDWWCADLGTENPTDEDMEFWRKVFETHRKITRPSSKQKSDKQIIKWLKNPHSDSAEYKMWGNGVALPCVYFVLSGIAWYTNNFDK